MKDVTLFDSSLDVKFEHQEFDIWKCMIEILDTVKNYLLWNSIAEI